MIFQKNTFFEGEFRKLYHNYFIELCKYNGAKPVDFTEIYLNYRTDEVHSGVTPYYIIDGNDKQKKGFIVLQYVGEAFGISPGIWYIVEFYIFPSERRKGYGFSAVKHFVEKYQKDFFIEILKDNITAYNFWRTCFNRLKLDTYTRDDIAANVPPDTDYYCVDVRKNHSSETQYKGI